MTEFLRARRDLTLIGVSVDMDMGGECEGCGMKGRWQVSTGSSRSQSNRLNSLHLDKQRGKHRRKSDELEQEDARHRRSKTRTAGWKFDFPTP